MCAAEPDREWSGVLFYSSTGSFGQDDFAIRAECFHLMDVGTSVFTGYDYDPEFIKFMMSNPKYLSWKKGHIHSHNKMGVFFSATDTDEIVDNSEFHNYYLSLIVNNRNEMVAKVAFRGKNRTESMSYYSYRGDDGAEISGCYPTTTEETVVYVHDCEIFNNNHTMLSSRYEEIKKKPVAPPTVVTGFHQPVKNEGPFTKTKNFRDSDDWDTDLWGDYAISEKSGKKSKDKTAIESFIVKVMVGDPTNEESIKSVMGRFSIMSKSEKRELAKRMDDRLIDIYISEYPYDQNLILFDDIMQECADVVEGYEKKYPTLVEAIWPIFNVVKE